MKKLFVFLLAAAAGLAQVQTVPDTTFPNVRSILNSNFNYLNTQLLNREYPLTFSSPLSRSGNTISCPTCGTGGGGGAVSSVFGRIGAVVGANGDYNTSMVTENPSYLYFTNARAQAALVGLYQTPITTGTTSQYFRGDLTLAPFPTSMTPLAHATTHASNGTDPISLASIGAAADQTSKPFGGGGACQTAASFLSNTGISAGQYGVFFDSNNSCHPTVSDSIGTTTDLFGWNLPGFTAPKATALANTPSQCSAGNYPLGVDASGNAQNCTAAGNNLAPNYELVFDGSTTTLSNGQTLSGGWTCGSGSGAQCTASWTPPSNVNWVRVQAWSGGAGGSHSVAGTQGGAGGGGGAYVDVMCPTTPGTPLTVAVGLGGATDENGGYTALGTCFAILGATTNSGVAPQSSGVPGYVSGSMPGVFVTSGGAPAGMFAAATCTTHAASGTIGYSASNANQGGCGAGAADTSGNSGAAGGKSIMGGGGGGSGAYNANTAAAGGTSGLGGAGGNGAGWTAGAQTACTNGSIPGGGGGGAAAQTGGGSNMSGCSGARGEVRVYYVQ